MATSSGIELLTSDPDAAADFYAAVVGWRSRPFEGSRKDMTAFLAPTDADVAGLMAIPAEAAASGMRPRWLGYIGVDNVDEAASSIVAAGGTQHIPPTDIPGVGRLRHAGRPPGCRVLRHEGGDGRNQHILRSQHSRTLSLE